MDKKKKALFPNMRKDIKDFLLKEEGNMIKKDVVKMGIGLLIVSLGLKTAMKADPTQAANCCIGSCAPTCRPSHCSHSSHSSHSNHSNHSSHDNHTSCY
jgi:hypothetical protein